MASFPRTTMAALLSALPACGGTPGPLDPPPPPGTGVQVLATGTFPVAAVDSTTDVNFLNKTDVTVRLPAELLATAHGTLMLRVVDDSKLGVACQLDNTLGPCAFIVVSGAGNVHGRLTLPLASGPTSFHLRRDESLGLSPEPS